MIQSRYQATAERGDEIQILHVQGELDLATADSLAGRGCSAIASGARLLLVELSGLSFCDAYGLHAFVRIANKADEAGCRYGLVAPQRPVAKILRISGLDRRLPTFASTDNALAHLARVSTLIKSSKDRAGRDVGPGGT
jgi:anti-anti-sigma factor